jgi:hypothetical protein
MNLICSRAIASSMDAAAPSPLTRRVVRLASRIGCVLGLALPLCASADTLLYDNGADLGLFGPLDSINTFHQVTDDFTLSSAATLERIVFSEDVLEPSSAPVLQPTAVAWCIGASQFSSSVACGTGTISPSATGRSSGSVTNFSSSFGLPNVAVAAGSYWLTLGSGSTDDGGHNTYWSVSATSGTAQLQGFAPAIPGISDLNNEASFQIYGTLTSVPEPGSFGLVGSGLVGCAAIARRRNRA